MLAGLWKAGVAQRSTDWREKLLWALELFVVGEQGIFSAVPLEQQQERSRAVLRVLMAHEFPLVLDGLNTPRQFFAAATDTATDAAEYFLLAILPTLKTLLSVDGHFDRQIIIAPPTTMNEWLSSRHTQLVAWLEEIVEKIPALREPVAGALGVAPDDIGRQTQACLSQYRTADAARAAKRTGMKSLIARSDLTQAQDLAQLLLPAATDAEHLGHGLCDDICEVDTGGKKISEIHEHGGRVVRHQLSPHRAAYLVAAIEQLPALITPETSLLNLGYRLRDLHGAFPNLRAAIQNVSTQLDPEFQARHAADDAYRMDAYLIRRLRDAAKKAPPPAARPWWKRWLGALGFRF